MLPETKLNLTNGTEFYSDEFWTVNFSATDNLSGIDTEIITIDGIEWLKDDIVDMRYLSLGEHEVAVSAYDNAGNYNSTSANFTIKPLPAIVEITPKTLNINSNGNWITGFIEVPGYSPELIDVSTVILNDTIHAEINTGIGDNNGNGTPDLMVKFNRSEVQNLIQPGSVTFNIEGKVNYAAFLGYTQITVIDNLQNKGNGDENMIFRNKNQFFLLLFSLLFLIIVCSAEVANIPDTAERQPSWSPDGQKIVFSSTGAMSEGLFVIKPDGSELKNIGGGSGRGTYWSPDGKKILFVNNFYNGTDARNGSLEIALLDIETQQISRITYNSLNERNVKFSPLGEKIILEDINQSSINIYIMNSDGTNLKKIVDSASSPEWSSDGKKIAYYTFNDLIEIWVINQDGTDKKRIFIDYQHRIFNKFKWTPDSRYLLLNNGSNTITKVNISDPTDIEYIYDPVAHWDPEYSPDGKYVTFVSDMDGGNPDLFVARSNGSDLYRLVYDTNPKLQNATPDYFYKKSRPAPPPWPTPEPTDVTSTAGPENTSIASRTPSIPGFTALAVFMILVSLVVIKRQRVR